ncbi:MAG TPA: DUF3618 domain-containing protein [Geminicoccus sp.]|jgi:uncharacterized protein YjbJ (UPF0337 family)|uniref:DUF3618 domain-containing protein n=1 Tax=Geminicoccus sp. TaxID=2024832 RepID=UPI002E364878|nr:DUF3618 domain-containing protein [Geminicoccus sp.]HEX2525831.1 DUF3618 domain-containing protein [Geminicoccus sp.]
MRSIDEKSSDEIEREVESSRANVQNTLRELSDRMSPGQLVDQAFGYMKTSGGAEFANNLGRSVRDNPLPLLLIGAGIGWLMMGGQPAIRRTSHHHDDAYRGRHDLGAPVGAFGDGVHRYDDRPGGYLQEAPAHYQTGGSTHGSGPSMTDRLSGAAGAVGGAARTTGSTVTGAARSTGHAVGGAVSSVGHAVGTVGSSVGHAVGSVGSAVGSAAGAVSSAVSGAADVVSSAAGVVSSVAATAAGAVSSAAHTASHALDQAAHVASSGYGSATRHAHDARHSLSGAASGLADQAGTYYGGIRSQGVRASGYAQQRLSRVIEDQPLVLGGVGLAIGAALGAMLPTTRVEDELVGETSDRIKAQVAEAAQEQYEHAKHVAGETYQEVADSLNESGIKEQLAGTVQTAAEKFRETAHTAADQAKERIGAISESAKHRIGGEQQTNDGESGGSAGGRSTSGTTGSGTSVGSGSSVGSTASGSSTTATPTSVGSSATGSTQKSDTDSTSTPLTSGSGSGSTSGLGSTSASGSAVPTSSKPALGDLDKKI